MSVCEIIFVYPPSFSSDFLQVGDTADTSGVPFASYAKWSRLFAFNRPELCFIVLGCVFSFIVGAVFPTFAVIFALNLDLLSNPSPENGMGRVSLYVVIFVVIGVVDLIAHAAQVGLGFQIFLALCYSS